MRLNFKFGRNGFTHEGAPAAAMNDEQALRRSIMSCLLWESEFYEDGEEIGDRIVRLASKLPAQKIAALAIVSLILRARLRDASRSTRLRFRADVGRSRIRWQYRSRLRHA